MAQGGTEAHLSIAWDFPCRVPVRPRRRPGKRLRTGCSICSHSHCEVKLMPCFPSTHRMSPLEMVAGLESPVPDPDASSRPQDRVSWVQCRTGNIRDRRTSRSREIHRKFVLGCDLRGFLAPNSVRETVVHSSNRLQGDHGTVRRA